MLYNIPKKIVYIALDAGSDIVDFVIPIFQGQFICLNDISDKNIIARLQSVSVYHRLQALQRTLSLDLHRGLEGQTAEVLVEGPDKKGHGLMSGRCRAGRMVNFPGGPELVGRLVTVRIEQGRENSLLGSLEPAPGSETS